MNNNLFSNSRLDIIKTDIYMDVHNCSSIQPMIRDKRPVIDTRIAFGVSFNVNSKQNTASVQIKQDTSYPVPDL